jgi:hypothetical protein
VRPRRLAALVAAAALACACEELGASGGAKSPEGEGAPDAGAVGACPSPKNASSNGVLFARLTAHPWCSVTFLGAEDRTPPGRLVLGTDGRAVFRADQAAAPDSGAPAWASTPEHARSGCWRLEGKQIEGSDDGRTFTPVPFELSEAEPPTLRLRGATLTPCP